MGIVCVGFGDDLHKNLFRGTLSGGYTCWDAGGTCQRVVWVYDAESNNKFKIENSKLRR